METERAINCTRERIIAIAREWIGTPYHHQASLKGVGCDCLGLVSGVWREATGQGHEVIEPYTPDWGDHTGKEAMLEGARRYLVEITVADMVPGDVALFRMMPRRVVKHCGIVAERNGQRTIIHALNAPVKVANKVEEIPLDADLASKLAYAFKFAEV